MIGYEAGLSRLVETVPDAGPVVERFRREDREEGEMYGFPASDTASVPAYLLFMALMETAVASLEEPEAARSLWGGLLGFAEWCLREDVDILRDVMILDVSRHVLVHRERLAELGVTAGPSFTAVVDGLER